MYPNGATYEAATCEEVENYVKSLRWEFFWDHQHFREVVASETWERSWNEIELDTDGTSRDFLQEMERAGYFTVGFHFEGTPDNGEYIRQIAKSYVDDMHLNGETLQKEDTKNYDPW